MKVFCSVGKTSTPQQEEFVRAIESYLRQNDLEPMIVGRTSFSSKQPLRHIRDLMRECAGTVIIAFERTHIDKGLERRGSPDQVDIDDTCLPTVWNQIEAAMAYVHDHPLLVIVQHGLKSEGLLENGYDWYVQWIDLNLSTLGETEFQGVFADWKKQVAQESKIKNTDTKVLSPEKLSIGQIMSSLTVPQLWALVIAFFTLLAAVATISYKLGSGF